jgi:hypothetical protein
MVGRTGTLGTTKRFRCREQGQSLVETALVLGLLLLLLAGVADFGRAFHSYIIITNATREGARRASRFPRVEDESYIKDAVIQEALTSDVSLDPGDIVINGLPAEPGDPIRVIVTYEFSTIMGSMVSRILGTESIALQASTEMIAFGLD